MFFYRKSVNVSLTFLKATNTLVEIYFVTVMLYEYSRGLDIAFKVHEFNVMPFCQIYLEVFPIRPGQTAYLKIYKNRYGQPLSRFMSTL